VVACCICAQMHCLLARQRHHMRGPETAGSRPARRLTVVWLPASRGALANPEDDRVALINRHSARRDALTARRFLARSGVPGGP